MSLRYLSSNVFNHGLVFFVLVLTHLNIFFVLVGQNLLLIRVSSRLLILGRLLDLRHLGIEVSLVEGLAHGV